MAGHPFDLDTAVSPLGAGRYRAELHERWSIEGVPNGGYMMAVMLAAARQGLAHPDPLSSTAHFLGRASAGPAEIEVDVVKAGRSLSTVEVRLHQDGRERIRLLTTLGNLGSFSGIDHASGEPPDLVGPFVRGWTSPSGRLPGNFRYEIPASMAGGLQGKPSGRPEMAGRIAFVPERPPDLAALILMVDSFPPGVYNLGHRGWTPTLELTVHCRAHPAPGPVTARFHTRAVIDGLLDEEGELWDSAGRLVALSRQLARML